MAWVKLRDGQRDGPRGAHGRLPRADRHLQDPALLEVRRRVPDDGHRQGPEVPHARDRGGGAGGASDRMGADGCDRGAHGRARRRRGPAAAPSRRSRCSPGRARWSAPGATSSTSRSASPTSTRRRTSPRRRSPRSARARRTTAPRPACPSCARRPPRTWRARAACRSPPERVVVANGAKPFMFFAILAPCEPGDEVIYPDPGFPIYESAIRFVGATPVPLPLREERDFRFALDELDARLSAAHEARHPQLAAEPDRRRHAGRATLAATAELILRDAGLGAHRRDLRAAALRAASSRRSRAGPACSSGRSCSTASRRPTR